jgi:prepilin peptidase CpaA
LNLVAAAPLWLIILFGCAMVAAAIEDGARLRISNVTSLLVVIGAIVAAVIAGPQWSLWQNILVFVVLLTLGTFSFSAGWLGGGDVKLFAATGLWFDLRSAVGFLALVFLAGGLVAILYIARRAFREAGKKKGPGVPYGIAIAVGACAMVLLNASAFQHRERPLPPIRIAPHHP